MSTIKKTVFLFLFAVLQAAAPCVYGSLDVVIRLETPVWKIKGIYTGADSSTQSKISFLNTYADAEGLAKRVSKLKAFDSAGNAVELTGAGDGHYDASAALKGFEYEVDTSAPTPVIAAPHVSWATRDQALIKLLDLLPEMPSEKIRVVFELPEGWSIYSGEKQTGGMEFETSDYERAVFFAGTGIRVATREIGGAAVLFSIAGKWQFEDAVVAAMTSEILAEYQKIFGSLPDKEIQINLLPFPEDIGNDRWRAQTQAGTVTIVSSPSTYGNLAAQRLHEQLRHELFHFWIPEGIDLKGDYAWFYEGFARYQSLKTGVWVGRIGFDDFLRSMSEAINISAMDRSGLPLDKLSESIWLTGPGVVAAKGMSIAFYCDLALLAGSGGKRNSAEILKNLYNKYRGSNASGAFESVEAELNLHKELRGVVDRYIKGTEPIEWQNSLLPFGITIKERNGRSVLSVESTPKGKTKALLNKLGYTRWKKYSPNS